MWLEVDPGDGGGRNRIGYAGERGLGAIVENVEAADAEMVVVVDEELGQIDGLVLDCAAGLVLCQDGFCNTWGLTCHTDCHVLFVIRGWKFRERCW